VIYETDLAFCASYKDGTEIYSEGMKHTQAKSHDLSLLRNFFDYVASL